MSNRRTFFVPVAALALYLAGAPARGGVEALKEGELSVDFASKSVIATPTSQRRELRGEWVLSATVADNAAQRRAAIKDQIAQTTQQLQNATTDAEVQKLHGVLTSLNADLASTDDEVNQAASAAMVQDIQNRNDQQKQIQALTEQQNAEFAESVSNYTAKFQLLNAPTTFPTP